jgi:hypothetical protein
MKKARPLHAVRRAFFHRERAVGFRAVFDLIESYRRSKSLFAAIS